jgi:transcriptional regulator with XRE-family HTH domain
MAHTDYLGTGSMAISNDEKAFFVRFGARIAALRKARGITQVQMAELLGVSQQTVNSYEVGRRRVPLSALPVLAKALTVSLDELMGEQPRSGNGKRGPAPKLQRQIEKIGELPRAKQRFVMEMLDTVLQQGG